MKQILQNLADGTTELAEVPQPVAGRGQLLIRTTHSLVSSGTERMLIDFGRAGLIEKARQQPDKVRMVIDKVRTDGLLPTLNAVRTKLGQPLPMGYCNAGIVEEVGPGVTGFKKGDRVASNGRHAELVAVPVNLCARIPDGVTNEAAAFTVLAAIGLQGIRLAQAAVGECVVVSGLGLIGLVTVQLLRASGCRVLGLDFDRSKLALARSHGAEVVDLSAGADPVKAAEQFSRGRGVDAVIITAATRSSEPVHQAALMCRKRGRIVLVGVTGLELSRADFYEKELTFQVSCSYGPGRYDPAYEQQGQDYPVGFVRWTAQRNFEAALDMFGSGRVDVSGLVSHRFDFAQAPRAYEVIAGSEPSLGIILKYPAPGDGREPTRTVELPSPTVADAKAGRLGVSLIGAGNYAGSVLLPALAACRLGPRYIAGAGGPGSVHLGKKFGFLKATTDTRELLSDLGTDIVVVATRHDSHARYLIGALQAGKHVFVEKPLCLTLDELDAITAAVASHPGRLVMVGFNRRFSPHVRKIKALLDAHSGPLSMIMTVNAGFIPPEHWTQDAEVGGGRLVGEGCHFIDLLRHIAGARIESFSVSVMSAKKPDSATIQLRFSSGSIGTIHYLANGTRSFPKERLEIFAGGGVLQLDNFRKLRGFGWPGLSSMSLWRQDKGQVACVDAFVRAVSGGGASPIPFDELVEVARTSILLQEAAR